MAYPWVLGSGLTGWGRGRPCMPAARFSAARTAIRVRVAIDARKLHDYGIGTYVRNLVRHLARLDRDNTYVLICRPDDVAFAISSRNAT